MTCPHCQTWILDEEHRCRRCGRRVRSTPAQFQSSGGSSYPASAAATALAYDFHSAPQVAQAQEPQIVTHVDGQQALFTQPVNEPRVIPFDSLTSPAERESIRARAAEVPRPAPVKTEKVQLKHARAKRRNDAADQRALEFLSADQIAPPKPSIICDAPVAPPSLRLQAGVVDGLIMAAGAALCAAIYVFAGGHVPSDKHLFPFFLLGVLTVPLLYKVMWAYVGRDSIGMQRAGLELVDFDGNPPSARARRYRLLGSFVSVLAAGMGLVWAFVDEDSLTWHDHISSTFPTIVDPEA